MEMIVTDELNLRTPVPETDGPQLAALIDRDRETLQQWLPWVPKTTRASEIAFLKELVKQADQHQSLQLVMVWQGNPVGMAGFNRFYQREDGRQTAEIGYWLANHAVRHGLMHQAVLALCQLGFATYQLELISIIVAVLNQRSNHVAQRAGFHLERVLPARITLFTGRQVDANDWIKVNPDGQGQENPVY
ncbi:GNAT family N-acetyltransferase [Fructilactobacillus myrtifloralis]|uniref:GNAT family N-acetyltransferase n=1 Tax=Fructilactobacillus myrtifloralis TaxID=2940301 RepID=A0ABY5BN55_9LACO|nr:GNAT family protein [Fructilactobacillus myrtifloralis]USS85108.1 GNAT family N-acetyltransferase [Fructilactobacillus myrtifloralis]